MIRSQKKLGEILKDKGLISEKDLDSALEEQEKSNEFLGKILLRKNQIKERQLLAVLSEQFNIEFISLEKKYMDWKLAKEFSPSLIIDHRCIPISKKVNSVTFAISNPLDIWKIKKAEEEAGRLRVKLVLVSERDIDDVVSRYKKQMRADLSKRLKFKHA